MRRCPRVTWNEGTVGIDHLLDSHPLHRRGARGTGPAHERSRTSNHPSSAPPPPAGRCDHSTAGGKRSGVERAKPVGKRQIWVQYARSGHDGGDRAKEYSRQATGGRRPPGRSAGWPQPSGRRRRPSSPTSSPRSAWPPSRARSVPPSQQVPSAWTRAITSRVRASAASDAAPPTSPEGANRTSTWLSTTSLRIVTPGSCAELRRRTAGRARSSGRSARPGRRGPAPAAPRRS